MDVNKSSDKNQSLSIKKTIYNSVPQQYHASLDNMYKSIEYQNYSPVKRMEEVLGISGIYHQYKFPNNISPLEYEAKMKPMRIFEVIERGLFHDTEEFIISEHMKAPKPESLFAIRQMYQELVELNPELKAATIKPNLIRSYVAVISGACSGFPPEDIIEFSNSTNKESNDRINNEKREFSKLIEERTGKRRLDGGHLIENWCPSEPTRHKIMQKLNIKTQKPRIAYEEELSSLYGNSYYSYMKQRGMFD